MSYDSPSPGDDALKLHALTKDEERALEKMLRRLAKQDWPLPLAGSRETIEFQTDLLEQMAGVEGAPVNPPRRQTLRDMQREVDAELEAIYRVRDAMMARVFERERVTMPPYEAAWRCIQCQKGFSEYRYALGHQALYQGHQIVNAAHYPSLLIPPEAPVRP
jgi:hypothetical protein